MKIVTTFLLSLLLIQTPALGSIETDIPESNRVILKSGDWMPSAVETRKALTAIQAFLERPVSTNHWQNGQIKKILENIKKYRVQFAGRSQNKRRIIWCNFFPTPEFGNEKNEFKDWKKTEVEVMDGGYWYWRIDYDPGTGKCRNFSSNGYA